MGDLRLDVVFVGAVDPGVLDVLVVDVQLVALADQALGQFHQRAFAQVVGAGLEAQAEQGDLALVVGFDQLEGVLHLRLVAEHQRIEQGCSHVEAGGAVGEGAHVLGQARTAEGKAWAHVVLGQVQHLVLADHVHHVAAIDTYGLGDVADFVGEGDLGGVPHVAGVLDHLGHFDRLADDRCVELFVQALQYVAAGAVQFADDGHRWLVVVFDRSALTQELRVDRNAEVDPGFFARAIFENRDHHVLDGTWQHGAAYHDGVAAGCVTQYVADFAAHRFDVLKAQVAVLLARRTDADHRHIAGADGLGEVSGAAQAAIGDALLQQCFQARFDDGRLALVDQVDLGAGHVHANHFMASRRQAACTDRTYITQTKDADTHRYHLMCVYHASSSGRAGPG